MADKQPHSFEEPLRRAMEANLRYYEALGQVTQEYWKAMFGILNTLPVRLGGGGATTASKPSSANATAPASAASLVLEGQLGSEAQGVFMVENRLPRTVSTAVVTSAFADPSGRALHHPLRVVPNVITLEPGGRTLVQIFATVTDSLEPNVAYRGEASVPGLSEHGIPILLRRHPSDAKGDAKDDAERLRISKAPIARGARGARGAARATGRSKKRSARRRPGSES